MLAFWMVDVTNETLFFFFLYQFFLLPPFYLSAFFWSGSTPKGKVIITPTWGWDCSMHVQIIFSLLNGSAKAWCRSPSNPRPLKIALDPFSTRSINVWIVIYFTSIRILVTVIYLQWISILFGKYYFEKIFIILDEFLI